MATVDLVKLAEEAERAPEGSRTLDAEVAIAVGAIVMRGSDEAGYAFFHAPLQKGDWAFLSLSKENPRHEAIAALGGCLNVKRYTTSLDAVTALIRERLPGCGYTLEYRPQYGDWAASVCSQGCHHIVPAATGALALLSATLRALAKETGHEPS